VRKKGGSGKRLSHESGASKEYSARRPFDNLERENNMQYRRISADCHLDMPWMPPDLFVS